jgi:pimeloyl-ACP methyl ester carboxylesterase
MDRIPGVNTETIDAITRDVYVYLAYPQARRVIDTLAAAKIGTDECVVLAHSLGTVVAYNVLATRAAAPKCARFITVGSPLGIRAIKRFLTTPVVSPPCVTNWFNGYDDHDIVALNALDSANFDVTPAIENKSDVVNFTSNRHGIAGYLADPVVARKIVEYL